MFFSYGQCKAIAIVCDLDNPRYYCNGVSIENGDAICSDAYKLLKFRLPLGGCTMPEGLTILKRAEIDAQAKIAKIKKERDVAFDVQPEMCYEGKFPPVEQAMPTEAKELATYSAEHLIDLLRAMQAMGGKICDVTLHFENEKRPLKITMTDVHGQEVVGLLVPTRR